MKTLKVLLFFFVIVLLFGCQPALHGNLRNNLLVHNYPALQVDFPIANPITLELKEDTTNKISGDCIVRVIFNDKSKNERFELAGTIYVEINIVRVAEAVNYRITFKLKNAHIRAGNEEAAITKSNIEEIFKKDNFKKVFNKYNLGFTLNKSTKEISITVMDKTEIQKVEDSILWDNFEENYIKSPQIRTGDKIFPLSEKVLDLLKSDIKKENFDVETFFHENEAKGIKTIADINYLTAQSTYRIVGRFYDKKANEYEQVNLKGGGYTLYEIPNLFASKYVYTFYIGINDFDIAISVSFDGKLLR
ncbi:MAG: hypothetical protein PF690_05860 [Deltaproteobacteria bacterium]|nr:hypothetical protein [Deltaproteobacteria bacterium]